MLELDGAVSPRVEWLTVTGDADVWRSLGFFVADDGLVPLHGTSLRIVAPTATSTTPPAAEGLIGWALSGVQSIPTGKRNIDGLVTEFVSPRPPTFADHPIGAIGLDHVVVMTCDLDHTSVAIAEATGCELKRIREVGEMRQGFHRIGSAGLIVELVERPDIPDGPAAFWGLVVNVDDLDLACDLIGPDLVSPPKGAVQPGRRIATIRNDAGLGLPVALMTT